MKQTVEFTVNGQLVRREVSAVNMGFVALAPSCWMASRFAPA
jgi:hypothetical protein